MIIGRSVIESVNVFRGRTRNWRRVASDSFSFWDRSAAFDLVVPAAEESSLSRRVP